MDRCCNLGGIGIHENRIILSINEPQAIDCNIIDSIIVPGASAVSVGGFHRQTHDTVMTLILMFQSCEKIMSRM